MQKTNKHRDSFYSDTSAPSFEEVWDYFKDVICPNNDKIIIQEKSKGNSEKEKRLAPVKISKK